MSDGDQIAIPFQGGLPLGRHVNHDPRSRGFVAAQATTLKSVSHRRYGAVLDQGQVGACTGFATAQAMNHVPVRTNGVVHKNPDGLAIYERATVIDPFPGSYPPQDTGSDGLSACKAAAERGWIREYRWAFGIDQALAALVIAPVITGTNWYEGMDTPDPRTGRVSVTGQIRGGHEYCAYKLDVKNQLVWFLNSWSANWGLGGKFCMTWAEWARLLGEQGDVTVLVR